MTRTNPSPEGAATAFSIGLGAAVLLLTVPASASPHGMGATSTCSIVNQYRFQCNFPALNQAQTLEIQYVSMQCGTAGTPFSLQEFQVLTTPPNSSSEVSYQIPISNQVSLERVVSAGSSVNLYAKGGSQPRALIDLSPAFSNPGTQCTVSLSGVFGGERE